MKLLKTYFIDELNYIFIEGELLNILLQYYADIFDMCTKIKLCEGCLLFGTDLKTCYIDNYDDESLTCTFKNTVYTPFIYYLEYYHNYLENITDISDFYRRTVLFRI